MNHLFVYGIFLNEGNRERYGMTNPRYAVVPGYATRTCYGDIVEAVPVQSEFSLTGLYVDIDPAYWERLDRLEHGYQRVEVNTSEGRAWMYQAKEIYDE